MNEERLLAFILSLMWQPLLMVVAGGEGRAGAPRFRLARGPGQRSLAVVLEHEVAIQGGTVCLVVPPGLYAVTKVALGRDVTALGGDGVVTSNLAPRFRPAFDEAGKEVPGGVVAGWINSLAGAILEPGRHEVLVLSLEPAGGEDPPCVPVSFASALRAGADGELLGTSVLDETPNTVPASGQDRRLSFTGLVCLALGGKDLWLEERPGGDGGEPVADVSRLLGAGGRPQGSLPGPGAARISQLVGSGAGRGGGGTALRHRPRAPDDGRDGTEFRRGDASTDGRVDITDAVFLARVLSQGRAADLECQKSADFDDSGHVDFGDVTLLLGYLFRGGLEAAKGEGFTIDCDADPTGDGLSCAAYTTCD